jgi:hypothetical protein
MPSRIENAGKQTLRFLKQSLLSCIAQVPAM